MLSYTEKLGLFFFAYTQVKKESAEAEKAWHGSGEQPGLKIWRIVNFEVIRRVFKIVIIT